MNFKFTEEQMMVKETAKEFADNIIAPIAEEVDKTGTYPRSVITEMGKVDLTGLLVPPPFGGIGSGALELLIAAEEMAKVNASVAWSFVSSAIVAIPILAKGTDEQKKKYLPSLASGEKMGAYAVTEPSGGTNWVGTAKTTAVLEGDEYVINGSKCFISNAKEADIYLVTARTGDPSMGPGSFSVFIVEKGTPGFTFGKSEDKLGLKGDPTGELFFDNCRIPKENLLGQVGEGYTLFLIYGGYDCIGEAAVSVGIAQGALDAVVKYAKERVVRPPATIAYFDNVQQGVADMQVRIKAARLVNFSTVDLLGKGPQPLVLTANMYCNEIAVEATGKAMSLIGGYGATTDFPLERFFRDAKTLSLHKTSDYLRATAGKMILDVPLGGPPPKK